MKSFDVLTKLNFQMKVCFKIMYVLQKSVKTVSQRSAYAQSNDSRAPAAMPWEHHRYLMEETCSAPHRFFFKPVLLCFLIMVILKNLFDVYIYIHIKFFCVIFIVL